MKIFFDESIKLGYIKTIFENLFVLKKFEMEMKSLESISRIFNTIPIVPVEKLEVRISAEKDQMFSKRLSLERILID